jgi:hypothetical protein
LSARKTHDAHLRDHDRPAENRADEQETENELAGYGGVFEREEKTASRENLQGKHERHFAGMNTGV